jgi:hypothetical protein
MSVIASLNPASRRASASGASSAQSAAISSRRALASLSVAQLNISTSSKQRHARSRLGAASETLHEKCAWQRCQGSVGVDLLQLRTRAPRGRRR